MLNFFRIKVSNVRIFIIRYFKHKKTDKINLKSLHAGFPGLTPGQGIVFAEAAAVCLERNKHISGTCNLIVNYTSCTSFLLSWPIVTNQVIAGHFDPQDATEEGAMGLAILILPIIDNKIVIQRTYKGTGFDYWVGPKDQPNILFTDKLEISGILEGNDADIRYRINEKFKQVNRYGNSMPAYVVVVEFSSPIVKVEKR